MDKYALHSTLPLPLPPFNSFAILSRYKIRDPVPSIFLPFSDLDTAVVPVPATAAPQVRRPLQQLPNLSRQNDFPRTRKQARKNLKFFGLQFEILMSFFLGFLIRLCFDSRVHKLI